MMTSCPRSHSLRTTLLVALLSGFATGQPQELPEWVRLQHEPIETVLCVAAHPDDEDSGLLLWAREYRGPAHVLFVTNGEGGQNAIGPELGERLGEIRKQEILRACEVTGATPHFLGFLDFGFSKRADESFERWGGQEEVVRRMVEVLRRVRPDSVYTNHTPDLGHGHHRASSIALREAVVAAADPKRFPEQLSAGLEVWKAEFLYERTSPDDRKGLWYDFDVMSHVETDATLAELAHRALLRHRSQGPWPDFQKDEVHRSRYRAVIRPDVSLPGTGRPPNGVAGLGPRRIARTYQQMCEVLNGSNEFTTTPAQAMTAIADTHNLRPSILSSRPWTRPGREFPVLLHMPEPRGSVSPVKVEIAGAVLRNQPEEDPTTRSLSLKIAVNESSAATVPIEIRLTWDVEGVPRPITRILPWTVDVYRDGPRVEAVRPRWPRSGSNPAEVELSWSPTTTSTNLTLFPEDGTRLLHPADGRELPSWTVPASLTRTRRVMLRVASDRDTFGVRCKEDDLATESRIEGAFADVDAKLPPELEVVFVEALDGTAGRALRSLGAHVTIERMTGPGRPFDPSPYDVVVLDVRLLGRFPAFRQYSDALRQYVHDGGTLLVLYHKSPEWNSAEPDAQNPAPYRLEVMRARVCEEDAAVRFLQPDHPLMTTPYRIDATDFEGWVQERGLYFPEASYDERYVELLSMHDRDEPERRGSLLTVQYGQGRFTYCALSLHRQLRACHPGAFRLLANLVTPDRLR